MSKILDRVNSRGLASGWHADRLLAQARSAGKTMAMQFSDNIANAVGFSVPARAIAYKGGLIIYKFLDGSTTQIPHKWPH